jgi:hypothetical protein
MVALEFWLFPAVYSQQRLRSLGTASRLSDLKPETILSYHPTACLKNKAKCLYLVF